MLKFETIKLMASIFTPDFSIGNQLLLINQLQELSGNKFDGDIFSGQIPQEAPAGIPRAILSSKDNCWKLEISLERTNLIFIKTMGQLTKTPKFEEFGNYATKLFSNYKKDTEIRIQRLAIVTERTLNAGENPSYFLSKKFCKNKYLEKNKPFDEPDGFEIHSLKKYNREGFNINSWVRLKSAILLDSQKTRVLLVINDVNTFPLDGDTDKDFNKEEIIKFYGFFPQHIEAINNLYFNQES